MALSCSCKRSGGLRQKPISTVLTPKKFLSMWRPYALNLVSIKMLMLLVTQQSLHLSKSLFAVIHAGACLFQRLAGASLLRIQFCRQRRLRALGGLLDSGQLRLQGLLHVATSGHVLHMSHCSTH